jgi:hypothetical protein
LLGRFRSCLYAIAKLGAPSLSSWPLSTRGVQTSSRTIREQAIARRAATIDAMDRDPAHTAVIVDALRTPFGRYGGALAEVRPDDMAAHVIRRLVERTGVDPASIDDVIISPSQEFQAEWVEIDGTKLMSLAGQALYKNGGNWEKQLYRPLGTEKMETAPIRLIPYFAWANRGASEMAVWMPFDR